MSAFEEREAMRSSRASLEERPATKALAAERKKPNGKNTKNTQEGSDIVW